MQIDLERFPQSSPKNKDGTNDTPGNFKNPSGTNLSFSFRNGMDRRYKYPNVARIILPTTKYEKTSAGSLAMDPEAKEINFFTMSDTPEIQDERVFIRPSSTLFGPTSFVNDSRFITFFTQVRTSKAFLRDVMPVGSLAFLLLCGDKVEWK
jgi:hypothetical protein